MSWFSSTPPFSPPNEIAFVLADTGVEREVGYGTIGEGMWGYRYLPKVCMFSISPSIYLFLLHFPLIYLVLFLSCVGPSDSMDHLFSDHSFAFVCALHLPVRPNASIDYVSFPSIFFYFLCSPFVVYVFVCY
jgi:hypothetical protein